MKLTRTRNRLCGAAATAASALGAGARRGADGDITHMFVIHLCMFFHFRILSFTFYL
jgi:hypothetical protein